MIVTKQGGNFIINSASFALGDSDGQYVAYRNDAIVQEFATEELMIESHKVQFPDYYIELESMEPQEPDFENINEVAP
jgi:hypothetical protein|tara:strand:+ start:275 stop:508 length:234 start_codon:yes stop_codon:yes gene_type:complete